jgi:RNA polymerase sigma factor (sigma-70 family)
MQSVDGLKDIYQLYGRRVYNTAISIVQNSSDAEEITQDVFVEIHKSLEKFKGDASLGTWVYRIAVNTSLDHLRHRKRQKRWGLMTGLFGKDDAPIDIPDFHHPGIELENKEQAAILFRAIASLPENQKTAFVLSIIEELPQKEVGEIMKISLKAVESLIQRAKSNLRKDLENFFPGRRN